MVANGLKSWVMVVSGELSMTSDRLAFELAELFEPEPEPDDPHAAEPDRQNAGRGDGHEPSLLYQSPHVPSSFLSWIRGG